jgi:hypothetical protein
MPLITELDIKPITWDGITPGGHTISDSYFFANVISMLLEGYSPMVGIVGKQRIGKSRMAATIAWKLSIAMGKPFDLKTWFYFEPRKMVDELSMSSFYQCRVMDEAIDSMHRKEWMKQSHILISKIISTSANLRLCHIWCLPFKSDLDKSMQKHWDFCVDCVAKGHAKVWLYRKNHKADAGKEAFPVFLDDLFFSKKDFPEEIWQIYEPWSQIEKEKIRHKYTKRQEVEENETVRLRRALLGLSSRVKKEALFDDQ